MKSERRKIWKCLLGAVLLTLLAFVSGGCAADTYTVCPDGSCNYTSIQAAIDNATAGDTIEVHSGTYNENVNVNKQLTLKGRDTDFGKPVVDAGSMGSALKLSHGGIVLDGFRAINASSSPNAGIAVYSNNNTIINNTASNNPYGIYLWSSSYNNLTGNTASNNNLGINMFSSSYNHLTGNSVSNNSYGIYLVSSSNNTLADNTVSSNSNEGISLYSSSTNNLTGNTALNNSYGIWIDSSSDNTLTGNTALNNSYGICLVFSSNHNNLMGNTASNNSADGIHLYSANKNILMGNTASTNSHGIYLYSSSTNNMLTGNTVFNNTYGICLDSSNHNNLTGNTALNNTYGIYLVYSSTNNMLTGNTASTNSRGICLDSSNHNNLTGNIVLNNSYGIYLVYSSTNNLLTSNTASTNSHGICLDSSNHNTLTGNTVVNNSYGIELLYSSTNNLLTSNTVLNNSYGIELLYSSTNNLTNNTVSNNSYFGIHLSSSNNNTLTSNAVLNNSYGIELVSSSTNNVTGNTVLNNFHGIWLYSSNINNVTGNTALNNSYGIYLVSSSNDNLIGNIFSNNTYGIYLVSSSNDNLIGNILSNNTYGIYLSSSSSNNVTGNTASNNFHGIDLSSSSTNNLLTGNTASNNSHGICLDSSTNNLLASNTVLDNSHGISLSSSSSNNLTGNIASTNSYGIDLASSSNNTLTGNTVLNNSYGIDLASSSTNMLTNNSAADNYRGIYLEHSSNNMLKSNTMSKNSLNFGVWGLNIPDYTQNIDTSNSIYGKPIYYLVNQHDQEIPVDAGYVGIVNSTNIRIKNLIITNNFQGVLLAYTTHSMIENVSSSYDSYGIYLYSSSNNTLTNNTATSNPNGGIRLVSSSTNNLTGNTVLNNSYGIWLDSSSTNNLTGNTANSNNYHGIYLSSSSSNNILASNIANANTITGIVLLSSSANTIIGNTATWNSAYGMYLSSSSTNLIYNNYFDQRNAINARDYGTNIWNITNTAGTNILGGSRLGGNYWSDYTGTDADGDGLGDTPYDITGGANKDYHPLLPYTHTDVGVTTDIELSDQSEIEDLVPPGTGLSNAVVIRVNVIDDTPDNPNDNAYTDITIYVCQLDVETCRVYKEGTGFLLEVPDVTLLPAVKPPGNASFSRDVTNNSVIIRLYVGDPLLAVLPPPEEVVTIRLDNVNVADCGETWSESGIELSFVTTTDEDCAEGSCVFELGETGVGLYTARLSLNFDDADGVFTEMEVDIVDWCGLNCTCAFLYNGSNRIDKVCNSIRSEKETLKVSSKGRSINRAAVSSCEGEISEIRLVKSKVYTKTDVGVTSTITIANSTELAANLPPEYAGMDISTTVVLTVDVTDTTPGNPADDAYTDITINVGTMDIGTCKVFKAGVGFLPEVADVTTLPTVKPPGAPAFSRNVAYNTVTVRLYVGDPLLAVVPPAEQLFFDTEEGAYPSISGTHNGTIRPYSDLVVSNLYTYPCAGTGGHTGYVKIWNSTTGWNVTATWNGYTGDWHNLSFNNSFTLYANETYKYTIRTGSYPQIIHKPSHNATGGVITCTEFVDINGKRHEGWIPAIRLY